MTPTNPDALRIAFMFHRKPSTPWSEKEIRRFKTLMIAVGDLELIERYYVYQRKRENGIHRRDLYTFLNNFSGELDRARAWDEEMRERLKRKVRRHLDPEDNVKQTNGADWKRIADLAKAEMERFKNQFA